MCTPPHGRAIGLEHGAAHDHDHETWARRDFLVRSGLAAVGGSMMLGATPVRAMARSPLVEALRAAETDRVLVLIQLQGGNDGLNTIVPVGNDLYYRARPTLGLAAADTLPLSTDLAVHPALAPARGLWDRGDLAIVQGVGYPQQDLSHFRGTDIWLSASDADEVLTTGWTGRMLAREFPDFREAPPAVPPAVQIGTTAPLLFDGGDAGYDMAMLDVDVFLRLAEGGDPYPVGDAPPSGGAAELTFARRVANDAFRYRGAIEAATATGRNQEPYPDTTFGRELAAVAQLIKGRLGARIYLVSLEGFDTHAAQADLHAQLLGELAASLAAFFDDLGHSADHERTLAVTFSEFGRRVDENGSFGTDHGTAAPLFLAGPSAEGGVFGAAPDLADLDGDGNLHHAVDFRQVYASVLEQWFELDPSVAAAVLGGPFETLPVVASRTVAAGPRSVADGVRLSPPLPNPLRGRGRVEFALAAPGPATLDLLDLRGRTLARLADGPRAAGSHTLDLDVGRLPAGTYLLRLRANGTQRTTRATVVR